MSTGGHSEQVILGFADCWGEPPIYWNKLHTVSFCADYAQTNLITGEEFHNLMETNRRT